MNKDKFAILIHYIVHFFYRLFFEFWSVHTCRKLIALLFFVIFSIWLWVFFSSAHRCSMWTLIPSACCRAWRCSTSKISFTSLLACSTADRRTLNCSSITVCTSFTDAWGHKRCHPAFSHHFNKTVPDFYLIGQPEEKARCNTGRKEIAHLWIKSKILVYCLIAVLKRHYSYMER